MIEQRLDPPRALVEVTVDGEAVTMPEGATLLEGLRRAGRDQPTLCHAPNLTPANACRVCVVEVSGSRALVPSCSRVVEDGMEIATMSDRVLAARRTVFELLVSAIDLSLVDATTQQWMDELGVDPDRYPAEATVDQPVKVQDELYTRDYAKCILCYKCVEACGEDAQNTFAIQVAGRGFDATISTEFDVPLPESACVYCGNCIGVCPTGALVGKREFDMRQDGTWDEAAQAVTTTICPYCGVGCNLELHVQDNRIVKVTSPLDHSVTSGHLCIKGRFGWTHVEAD
jgi:predicted molibdopterin-dependent oxidoreductase YjgC